MNCMYEEHNSELCQIVGDHLDGYIELYSVAHINSYFLTHWTLRLHWRSLWYHNQVLLLLTTLYYKHDLNMAMATIFLICRYALFHINHFPYLFSYYQHNIPLHCGDNCTVDSLGYYPYSNVTSTRIQLLSQLFTSSNTQTLVTLILVLRDLAVLLILEMF